MSINRYLQSINKVIIILYNGYSLLYSYYQL